jgi:hypothetical protein
LHTTSCLVMIHEVVVIKESYLDSQIQQYLIHLDCLDNLGTQKTRLKVLYYEA